MSGNGSCAGAHTNYILIGNKQKEQTHIEYEKIPKTSKIILKILDEDLEFWESKNLKQLGIEKYNLLKKVCTQIQINSNIFEMAIEELEGNQEILLINDGHFIRYIRLRISK